MATRPLLDDAAACPRARAVFDDIRATRGTDHVNNFWRAMAHDPETLEAVWGRLKRVMGETREGGLEPLTKELVYIAVSTVNGCGYCVHSHTAAARAKGATEAQLSDLHAVIAMAMQTNALATALAVPLDPAFDASEE